MKKAQSKEKCWLCGEVSTLRSSHVIPKFVFRWLINTGGTPYLRSGAAPNKRQQDGDKEYLYCQNCETLLSVHERVAKEKLFIPATRKEDVFVRYGPWLSRFATSLSLRTIQSQMNRGVLNGLDQYWLDDLNSATEVWRKFLISEITNPGKQKLFVTYLGYFDSFDAENLPQNWNTWVHRGVERDLVYTEDGLFIAAYTKIGPLIFWGLVRDNGSFLRGDFIKCNESTLKKGIAQNFSASVWHLLIDRASNMDKLMKSVSPKQKRITEDEVERNLERFAQSDLAQTLFDDFQQFGYKDQE